MKKAFIRYWTHIKGTLFTCSHLKIRVIYINSVTFLGDFLLSKQINASYHNSHARPFQYIWSVLTNYSRYITTVIYSLHNCAENYSSIHDQQIHQYIKCLEYSCLMKHVRSFCKIFAVSNIVFWNLMGFDKQTLYFIKCFLCITECSVSPKFSFDP